VGGSSCTDGKTGKNKIKGKLGKWIKEFLRNRKYSDRKWRNIRRAGCKVGGTTGYSTCYNIVSDNDRR